MKLKEKIKFSKKNKDDSNSTIILKENDSKEIRKKLMEGAKSLNENTPCPSAKAIANHFSSIRSIDLDNKVDDFIDWYYNNMVKGNYTNIGEYYKPNELKNFIEKMAVWYELRYPNYEINRLMPGSSQENIHIDEIMFKDIQSLNKLNWNEFYNTNAFINSLPHDERYFLSDAYYNNIIYIDQYFSSAHFHLSSNGIILESEGIEGYSKFKVKDKDLVGVNIKDALSLLEKNGIKLRKINEINNAIKLYEKKVYFKDELLNCVMYRIIERGGNRFGPRRAFLFAKEFGRNIDIPMKYGIDYSDPGLGHFINEYIKAGGSKDLICYVGYFSKTNKLQRLDTVSLQELIKTKCFDFIEETELYQKMVKSLSNKVDKDLKIKKLKL